MRKREIEKLLERAVAEALGVELKPRRQKASVVSLRKKPDSADGHRVAA